MAIQVGGGVHVWVDVGGSVVSVRMVGGWMDGWMDGTLVAVPVLLLRGAWTFLSYVPVCLCPFDSTSVGEEVRLDIDGLLLTRPPYHGVPHLPHLYRVLYKITYPDVSPPSLLRRWSLQ